jgi:glycosyltransferase involved in cell wall biosynthesis
MSLAHRLQSWEAGCVSSFAHRRPVRPVTTDQRLRRVLYAIVLDPSRKFGSLEEQVFILARAFRDRGSRFVPLFTAPPDPATLQRYRDAGLETAFLDLTQFRPATLERLVDMLRHLEIEIVHWNFFSPLANPYLWSLSVLTPSVSHFFTDHNSRTAPVRPANGGLQGALKRLLSKRYSSVVGVSNYVVDCLRHQGVWPGEPTRLLHFINTERFAPDPAVRAELRQRLRDDDAFVLVTVAYLIPAKGVDVVVRALADLPAHVRLWVVGDGPELGRLQAQAGDLGVQDRVRFLGLQSMVQPFLQAADAFVCPSRWAEAAGLVNLEAQATGLPVLASDIGGIPEYVADGQSGFLFPVGDHDQLADHVRRLAGDTELCREMGRMARARACRDFSVEARLGDFLALYAV